MMKNFTPHHIKLILTDGARVLPTLGVCRARSTERCAEVLDLDTDPPTRHHRGNWAKADQPAGELVVMEPPSFDGLEWIPAEPEKNETVIVSIVAAPVVASERPDLTVYVPDTGPESVVRSTTGQIEGVRRLILWHRPPTQIDIIQPYNLANPHDGWAILGSCAESDWEWAIELASRHGGTMYLVPGMQPCDAQGVDLQDGERRDSVESYLTGGTVHWGHLEEQGQHAAKGGQYDPPPAGCWARRAYDEGYESAQSAQMAQIIEEDPPS